MDKSPRGCFFWNTVYFVLLNMTNSCWTFLLWVRRSFFNSKKTVVPFPFAAYFLRRDVVTLVSDFENRKTGDGSNLIYPIHGVLHQSWISGPWYVGQAAGHRSDTSCWRQESPTGQSVHHHDVVISWDTVYEWVGMTQPTDTRRRRQRARHSGPFKHERRSTAVNPAANYM